MKEHGVVESWTKLYTIDIGERFGERFRRVLGFLKSGDVKVATRESWGDMLLYEPISQITWELYLYGLSESYYLVKENVYQHQAVLVKCKKKTKNVCQKK